MQQGLCSNNGKLWAVWKGEVGDDRLFFASYDGNAWSAQATFSGLSSVGPAIGNIGDDMLAAWKGEHSDQRLFYALNSYAAGWGRQAQIPDVASSVGPSLASFMEG